MLRLLKKEEYPDWIKQASIENEIIYFDDELNEIIWKGGTWKGGTWKGGTWKGGTWEYGIWESGIWECGIWKGGTWEYGIWESGIWKGGIWKGGIWKGGIWKGGTWEYGIWESGIWKGGTWEYGIWKDGFKRFVALTKWPIFYSQEKIIVGCKEFSIEEMILCRDENKFPFVNEFTEDQRKEIKKAVLTILFVLELEKNV